MKINATGLLLCTVLVGCGGDTAPFGEPVVEEEVVLPPEETIGSDRTLPPGTASPQPNTTIFRKEPQTPEGNGFATGVSYNAADDTFTVDNLPFDGGADTPYRRVVVRDFGEYAVYEAVEQFPDALTDELISQFRHRAIYGVSRSGNTEFAIVRTGDYVNFGFGGFVYERNGTVTLPSQGQAFYTGKGVGLRDYDGRGGLEYTTSDVDIAIDFDDFNAETGRYEGAVNGVVKNRRIFDLDGTEITDLVLARINASANTSMTSIPTAVFTVSTNALDTNGEITGEISSRYITNDGQFVQFETGTYYGIVSGDNAEELVGIVVAETSSDPNASTLRDTTGFTIYRDQSSTSTTATSP